jgi:mannose-6-phosphate isomerase-like protein (cupin superfamily)
MKEVDISQASDLSTLMKSGLEVTPKRSGKIQPYSYARPALKDGKNRAVSRLVTTDILYGAVQVFAQGGENIMHSHAGMDGFWMILGGRARFHFQDSDPLEFGPREGVCIPRDVKYWFENISDEPLEILQVDAIHPQIRNRLEKVKEDGTKMEATKALAVLDEIAFYDAQNPK